MDSIGARGLLSMPAPKKKIPRRRRARMFSYSHNILEQLAVCVMLAPPEHDDWDALIHTLVAVDKGATPQKQEFLAIVVLGEGYPRPDATIRRRLGDLRARLLSRRLIILVSATPALRGLLTALDWIAPRPPEERAVAAATFEDALRLSAEHRPRSLHHLRMLLDEACIKLGTTTRRAGL
jgi:hypothetical protein